MTSRNKYACLRLSLSLDSLKLKWKVDSFSRYFLNAYYRDSGFTTAWMPMPCNREDFWQSQGFHCLPEGLGPLTTYNKWHGMSLEALVWPALLSEPTFQVGQTLTQTIFHGPISQGKIWAKLMTSFMNVLFQAYYIVENNVMLQTIHILGIVYHEETGYRGLSVSTPV